MAQHDGQRIKTIATLIDGFCDTLRPMATGAEIGAGLHFVLAAYARRHVMEYRPDMPKEELTRRSGEIFEAIGKAIVDGLHAAGTPVQTKTSGSATQRN